MIGAGFTVTAVTNFVAEGIKLSAQIEGVSQAFKNLNQPNLLQNLRTATRGTVTDLELMRKAVQARNFKIPLNQLATYFEFATKRAIQTGESVDYLVDSIITGIGRKSVLVMDNLGISAVELQKEIAKVGDFGIASGNIIERELTSMGDVADTTATSIAQLATAWSDLKLAAGDFLINSGLKEFFQDLTIYMKVLQDPDVPLIGWKSPTHENLEEYRKQKEFLAEQQAVNMYSGGESAGGPLENMGKQIETIATLNEQLKVEKENLEQIDIADKKALTTQLQVIDALQKRIDQLSKLPEVRKENPLIEMLSVPKGFTEATNNSWKKLWDDYKEFQKIQNKLADAPEFKQPIEDMTEALMLQGEAINILTNSFDTLFTSAENGFQNMVETMIDGMKRLVAEYLAKAVIFGLIRALFPATELGKMATQNLWNMGLGGKATGGLGGFQSQPLNVNVVGAIKGKDIALALRRNG